jgi:hypothetical protein
MKIYEIDEELRRLYAGILNAVGDVDIVIINRINELAVAKEEKLLTLAKLIKEKEAEAAAMKAAEKDINDRRKRAEKWVSSARDYVLDNLEYKVSDSYVSLSSRESKAVVIEDEESFLIDDNREFFRYKEPVVSIDKAAIKNAMAQGQCFDGVRLEVRGNLQIK